MEPRLLVDDEYLQFLNWAETDLRFLIYSKKCASVMLGLAWHDAMTFDVDTKIGGPNGSIRNKEELNHAANAGLSSAADLCEDLKAFYPEITYADLVQLAGVVAVEVLGGPTIEFVPGRKDSLVSPREGNLPDGKQGKEHLREIYYRMGLLHSDIVALSGAHIFVLERSGLEGSWTKKPVKFGNSYFLALLEGEVLPMDAALLDDPVFRSYVELYAKDEDAFFSDYAVSHKKLSDLGHAPPLARRLINFF